MGCIRCVAARQQKEQHVRELREKMRLGPVNYISHNKFITARSASTVKPKAKPEAKPVVKKDAGGKGKAVAKANPTPAAKAKPAPKGKTVKKL